MNNVCAEDIQFYDHHPKPADFFTEVLDGLQQSQARIPPKFFYDAEGSRLFDAICDLPEYYPTRTEMKILRDNAHEIAACAGSECLLIEPGSGSSEKVRVLLDTLRPHAYMPMDISREHLVGAAQRLSNDYPWLDVHAACVDFTAPMELPYSAAGVKNVAFFPGSSIGNFERADAVAFLQNLCTLLGNNGGLLIGVDLKKEPAVLNAAYNDAQGITAAFNLNLLTRMNRELDANFDAEKFDHHAFYNESLGRIEMHLVSQSEQTVHVGKRKFSFNSGDSIHTENSYKYSVDGFRQLASQAGFEPAAVWTDDDALFSVHYLVTASQDG